MEFFKSSQNFLNNFYTNFFSFRICHIFIRYSFQQFLQFDTPTFEKLGKSFVKGLRWYIFFQSYESSLFAARRVVGIPGYQYDIDVDKEVYQKQIFTDEELKKLRESFQSKKGFEYRKNFVLDEKIHILEVKKFNELQQGDNEDLDCNGNIYGKYKKLDEETENSEDLNHLVELLGLKNSNEIQITEIEDENLKNYLNDRKFNELSMRDKFQVKLAIHRSKAMRNRFVNKIYDLGLDVLLYFMRLEAKNL